MMAPCPIGPLRAAYHSPAVSPKEPESAPPAESLKSLSKTVGQSVYISTTRPTPYLPAFFLFSLVDFLSTSLAKDTLTQRPYLVLPSSERGGQVHRCLEPKFSP